MTGITSLILKWWFKKRIQYNRALFFTGLMGFVAQAVQQSFNQNARQISNGLMPEMRVAGAALIAFLILANIAFTAGCVIDLIFNNKKSQSFRERLFLIGYGFAIVALISCIIAFLYLI
ncbi:MAG: hypothetical protein ABIN91_01830 [Mucilaginibacter sp.]|uniref:hypothetical protein n=1 Tax=Mucilaginibacter sp. TaxID=1882438 RepID=UPI00326786C6